MGFGNPVILRDLSAKTCYTSIANQLEKGWGNTFFQPFLGVVQLGSMD